MNDLIRRKDVLHELDGCDYELKDWQRWKLKTMVRDIPSAEKTQLSEEDATSLCKCPCEYREPCDYCPYHRHGNKAKYYREPHWIPCSERLPEKNDEVLVTGKVDNALYVDIDEWTGSDFWINAFSVIAWMPLPEPWEELRE